MRLKIYGFIVFDYEEKRVEVMDILTQRGRREKLLLEMKLRLLLNQNLRVRSTRFIATDISTCVQLFQVPCYFLVYRNSLDLINLLIKTGFGNTWSGSWVSSDTEIFLSHHLGDSYTFQVVPPGNPFFISVESATACPHGRIQTYTGSQANIPQQNPDKHD
jgi:hypothetical protein